MFPLELLTLLGSGLLGDVMTLWSMKLKYAQAQNQMLIARGTAQMKALREARAWSSPGVQITRRIIAITAVFSIILLPKLAALFMPDIAVNIGYSEFKPGFLFFSDGREVIKWVSVQGLTLTPLDTHTVSAIVGLYFGASITKNS